ncbi:MFS transporter [Candidatus Gottesmanbacteria bacterium]|nr:MFS transporter [Candidatus Gottesmanbacteria bacterium]
MGAYRQVIAVKPFAHLWFGQICSQLAVSVMLFVLAIRVYQMTGSNTAVSGLFLTYGVPSVLLGMAAGAVVDHLDKRRVLIVCDLLRAGMALGFMLTPSNLLYLYLLSTANSIVTQCYIPSQAPTIPRFIKGPLLVTANGLFSFTFYTSLALGSIIAGPLLRWLGPYGTFVVISALFVVASYQASLLPKQIAPPATVRRQLPTLGHIYLRVRADLQEGVRYILRSPRLRQALLLLTGTQIVLMILGTLGPGFADRMLKVDVHDASLLILGPVVLGIIAGALWVGWVGTRHAASSLIEKGVFGVGVILILIALTVRLKLMILPLEFLLFIALGVANSMLDVPANSMLQKETDEHMRGRVYGILTTAIGGVGIVPVVIGGVLADAIGIGKVIFFLGVVILLYGLYYRISGKPILSALR